MCYFLITIKRKHKNKTLQENIFEARYEKRISPFSKSAHLTVLIWNVMSSSHLYSPQNLSLNANVQLTCRKSMTESSVIHKPCIHCLQRGMFYSSVTSFHHLYNILIYSADILSILIKFDKLEILGRRKKKIK